MPALPDSSPLAAELRTVITRLVKKLRSHSPTHRALSLTERSVIKLLAQRQPLLPSELAAHEKVTTQAMSQILNRLAGLGYLTRQPAPTDRRKVLVELTVAGQALIASVRQEADDWLHQALHRTCSAAELATLRQAVPLLTRLVDVE